FLPTPGNVLFTLLMIGLLLWASSAGALPLRLLGPNVPSTNTIAYQGRLADAGGSPLTGAYSIIFRLYNSASGGAPLWEEQWTGTNGVQVSDGLFNVMLGSLTPIPQTVVTGNNTLWLGITVGTDDEMAPRVQLGSVPFAVQALTVPDGSVTTAKIADRAVTQAKLAVVPQRINCYPVPNCCFDQTTNGGWSGDLFTCSFTAPTLGFLFLSLQGAQKTDNAVLPCHFSIFVDGVNINTATRDMPSNTHTTSWHPSFMADTVAIEAGAHTISARIWSAGSNIWHGSPLT
ncbi:MAG: hypothetical protein WAW20_07730, partial [Anaerolineae bacterium]